MKFDRRKFFWAAGGAGIAGLIGYHVAPVITQDGLGTNDSPFSDRLAHGEFDNINSEWLYARLAVSDELRLRFPGWTTCQRCHFPWSIVKSHSTHLSGPEGIFALCRDCWEELYDGQTRLPYYRAVWERYWKSDHDWKTIEQAVLAES